MRAQLKQLTSTLRRFHDSAVFAKAPKMSERRIWINLENSNGYYERLQGEVGKSLFEALRVARSKVGGYCNGLDLYNLREKPVEPNANAPDCGLCYVEIKEEWYNKLDIHNLEKEILEGQTWIHFNKTKRLACCITLEPWMNEIVVRIPYDLPTSDNDIINM